MSGVISFDEASEYTAVTSVDSSATLSEWTCGSGTSATYGFIGPTHEYPDESAKQYKKKYDGYIDELRNNVDGYLKGVLDI